MINVNMIPNNDIPVLHCSEGDTEGRKFEVALHNNGKLIDASGIKKPLLFETRKGGTEEIFPSATLNGQADLGSLTWVVSAGATSGIYRMRTESLRGIIKSVPNASVANILCSLYVTVSNSVGYTLTPTMNISVSVDGDVLVYDERYNTSTSANDFKQAVQGVLLYYEANTTIPSTSPIIADIQYPDSLRSDQIFTYRESPTQEDGQAKIKRIQGNTVVFNQLVQNGNFVDFSNWAIFTSGYGSYTTSNNKFKFTVTTAYTQAYRIGIRQNMPNLVKGHKYLIRYKFGTNVSTGSRMFIGNDVYVQQSTYVENVSVIFTLSNNYVNTDLITIHPTGMLSVGDYYELSNICLFDLTAMGMDNLSLAEVEQWFSDYYPLPYYSYTTGKLLPFMGTELKVVGKNLFEVTMNTTTLYEQTYTVNADKSITMSGTPTGNSYIVVGQAKVKSSFGSVVISGLANTTNMIYDSFTLYDADDQTIVSINGGDKNDVTIDLSQYPNVAKIVIAVKRLLNNVAVSGTYYPMIRLADATDNTFEPYTENTLSLPITTYFPTGMKSLPNGACDEQTESKASLKIGSIVLDGAQTVMGSNFSSTQCRMFIEAPNVKPFASDDVDNGIISSYLKNTSNYVTYNGGEGIHRRINGLSQICVSLGANGYASGITTEALFNQYLASHPLTVYYELATPTEEEIITAELVCENGTAACYGEDDMLIVECNQEITSQSGEFPAKIKLQDGDGIAYSSLVKLVVEEKPNDNSAL